MIATRVDDFDRDQHARLLAAGDSVKNHGTLSLPKSSKSSMSPVLGLVNSAHFAYLHKLTDTRESAAPAILDQPSSFKDRTDALR